MRVHLEFLGLSRLVAGVTEISLDLEEGTTFRDIVPKLGTTYPAMRESAPRAVKIASRPKYHAQCQANDPSESDE